MNKKSLSEQDICTKFITPAIQQSGWDIQKQLRQEYTFTDGHIIVRGRLHTRGKSRRTDYVLFHQKNLPIAIVDAKNNKHSLVSGSTKRVELNTSQIVSIAVPVPPLKEQPRIVKKVDELMARCDQLKARLTQAQTLQQQLSDAVVEQSIT